MRLFVAISLPDAVRTDLTRALAPARAASDAARWIDREALHLTLQFLGSVADARVAEIEAALDRPCSATAPFTMTLGGFGAFPDAGRARVWWVGVEAVPALMRLQKAIEKSLQPLGFEPEARPFHPHITVARATPDATRAGRAAVAAATATFDYTATIEASAVDLMRSELRRTGARYHRERRFPLDGRD